MKVTKTSVHRLTVEKGCGCKATREYEDVRYAKPIGEGVFTACDKHKLKKDFAEFAGEMLIEALDKEAESAGKNAVVLRESTPTALQGTSGESVQSMGISPRVREKRDPLKTSTISRPAPSGPRPQNTGNLNVAPPADLTDEEMANEGITMDGDIEGVAADPRVDEALESGLREMDAVFDEDAGVM